MKIVKEGRKFVEGGFSLEDFMKNYSNDPNKNREKDKDRKNEKMTLADFPQVDPSQPRVKTFIKNDDD